MARKFLCWSGISVWLELPSRHEQRHMNLLFECTQKVLSPAMRASVASCSPLSGVATILLPHMSATGRPRQSRSCYLRYCASARFLAPRYRWRSFPVSGDSRANTQSGKFRRDFTAANSIPDTRSSCRQFDARSRERSGEGPPVALAGMPPRSSALPRWLPLYDYL